MCHIEFPHTGAHVDILVAPVALLAYRGVGESLLGELSQGRPGQDVARAPSKVATPVFEMMSEVDGFVGIERFKKIFEILNNHECVVICLEEPVKLVPVMLVAILEAPFSFSPEILPSLADVESHGPEGQVLLGAHEDELVTVGAPGVLYVDSLRVASKTFCAGITRLTSL